LNELGVEYDSGLARHLRIAARGGAWGRSSTEEVPTLEVLLTLVHELAKSEDAERGQRLGELVLDAEHSMDDGYDFDALGVLRAVAALSTDDDLIATAVWHARQALLRG
jgi:hypothetical protein